MMPEAVRIEKMIYGGTGVAEAGPHLAALPFVLAGELVEVAAPDTIRILEPSPDRVVPSCAHFGACGGCQYQHASYPAQVAMKTAILKDTLTAGGLTGLPEIAAHIAEPWRYRNRIRLRVGEVVGENGTELRVGYNRREAAGGDPLLPIVLCPIAAPLLWKAADMLVALAKSDAVVRLWMKAAVEIELFTTGEEAKLLMTVYIRQPPKADFAAFCVIVQRSIPQLSGAGVAVLPAKPSERGRRSERSKPGPQWGAAGIAYAVSQKSGQEGDQASFWVSRGSFFQVNRFLVGELARLATRGRGGSIAWDLYAGAGLFSRALTKSFAQVVAVEIAEPAATDLAALLKSKHHRAVAMTTADFLQAAVVQRERPELIVMDPPRAGVGQDACTLLARIAAPEIVYVSCDPVTLARDLKQLTDAGYKLQQLHIVDMFPQTFHIETVAVLTRRERN